MGTLIQAACDEPPTPHDLNPGIPAALNDLILRLLRKDPKDRPASAEAVAEELRRIERPITSIRPAVPPKRRWRWLAAAALLPLALLLGGVIYVETDKGQIKIETLDDDVEILVERNGKVVRILDTQNRNEATVRSGEYTLRIGGEKQRLVLDQKMVTVKRGDKVIAHISRIAEPVAAQPAPAVGPVPRPALDDQPAIAVARPHDPAPADLLPWIEDTKLRTPKAQIDAVRSKIKQLNPKFDETKMNCDVHNGRVSHVAFNSDEVTNLWPLRGFPRLEDLRCGGSWSQKGKLTDLSPLQGMKLTHLEIYDTHVIDLSPLRGMPLKFLWAGDTHIKDLTPLAGMPLEMVIVYWTKIEDISPLAGLPIRRLVIHDCPIKDFSPLSTMALNDLGISPGRRLSTTLMRSLWSLEIINEKPAIDFWKKTEPVHAAYLQWIEQTRVLPAEQQIAAVTAMVKERNRDFAGAIEPPKILDGKVIALTVPGEGIADLSPIRAFPRLSALTCTGSKDRPSPLRDLAPLRGMRLDRLDLSYTSASDLTPLCGLPLKTLNLIGTPVVDLAPLARLRLESLECDFHPERDAAILSRIKTLQTLNGKPAKEMLK